MMVNVSFARDFTLNLEGGRQVQFKKGPQQIEDIFLNHWYVAANLSDANGVALAGLRGTQDFLKEDLEMARQLMEEEEASRKRREVLNGLRSRANARIIHNTIAAMTPGAAEKLTPEARALIEAADRADAEKNKKVLAQVFDEAAKALTPVVEPKTLADAAAPLPPPIMPDPEMLALVRQPVGLTTQGAEQAAPRSKRPAIKGAA